MRLRFLFCWSICCVANRPAVSATIAGGQWCAKRPSFIAINGPVTQQDRWEEDGGYSTFTIAAEISALLIAADLAESMGEAERGGVFAPHGRYVERQHRTLDLRGE